ncbi:hypothetical protein Hanom_Chr15g01403131 [Helianthus anomalus]
MNRAEKVDNLIFHISEHTKSHMEMIDSSSNNLGHLAGRLAPSFVLSRTTGAALQLQREGLRKWKGSCYHYNEDQELIKNIRSEAGFEPVDVISFVYSYWVKQFNYLLLC